MKEAEKRGLVNDELHPDIQRFLDEYGLMLEYSVQKCTERVVANPKMWTEMLKNGTPIFPG